MKILFLFLRVDVTADVARVEKKKSMPRGDIWDRHVSYSVHVCACATTHVWAHARTRVIKEKALC